uniref:Acylamino-acid-releasing enzyme n=1 Tax=Junco hyemalis TaxID=40217 RepID=A0A8C5IR31_JUNHY
MGRTGGERGVRGVLAWLVGMQLVSSPCSPQSGHSGTWRGLRTSSSAVSTSSSTMEPPLSTRGPLAPALRSRTSKSHPAPTRGPRGSDKWGLMGTHPQAAEPGVPQWDAEGRPAQGPCQGEGEREAVPGGEEGSEGKWIFIHWGSGLEPHCVLAPPWHLCPQVWDQNRKVKSIDLTALDKHGSVYDDDQFGCLAWSHSETHLLYVAEKKRPKAESFFQSKAPELGTSDEDTGHPKKEDAPIKGEQFVYHEDWGETLSTRSVPVLCVLDIEGNSISVLEGIPEHLSPGQAFWSPEDTGVVFVGWWHDPFRLGLRHCTNRRSALFYVDLTGGRCELLSEDTRAVWSPRLSPDGCRIVYLENNVLGPHQQCSQLRMYDWYTKHTSTVLEAVPRQAWGAFPGIYCGALPGMCWAADSRRILLDTAQRSQQDVFVVDTATGTTTSLTADSPQGSWSVLTIDRDLLVARFSTPSCPPMLKVAVLPAAGHEAQTQWICLQDAPPVPGISWGIRTLQPPPEQEHPQYGGLDFDAILMRPSEGPAGQKPPLVVMPHGGPHSVFTAGWMLYPAALCRVGFAVLLVNYRGSLGFGQDSVASLPGNVGTQDVRDVQLCVERVLQEEKLDASRVALVGGSHGGFLACHLIGQFPDTYRACVVRNPVVNIASMVATTDIPDWCLTETGLPYKPDALPDPAQWTEMLHKSPIRYADRVRAPVLLMLGEDDRRVPPKQGLEYYRALKARGVPTRLLWYPGNNHALAGVEAEADGFMNMALWLLKHLQC